jgi:hypothetical protein
MPILLIRKQSFYLHNQQVRQLKGEFVPFELSRKGMIRYFLAHQAGNTEFRIKDYTPSEGTFGTPEYVPTSFKIEIVSTDIEEGEE